MKIDDAVFIVIDTETTGLDPKVDEVVEIAAVATSRAFTRAPLGMWASLVKPPIAIPPEAVAIHGIDAGAVEYAPSKAEALDALADFLLRHTPFVLCAHNASFDSSFVPIEQAVNLPWLCTQRLAQHLWNAAPNYKNQVLRRWLRPGALGPDTFGIEAHRALGDAIVTAQLLRDELCSEYLPEHGIQTVEELVELAESPILMPTLRFGNKHYGAPMAQVPADYLHWMLRNVTDLSRDLRYTVEQELQSRTLARAS